MVGQSELWVINATVQDFSDGNDPSTEIVERTKSRGEVASLLATCTFALLINGAPPSSRPAPLRGPSSSETRQPARSVSPPSPPSPLQACSTSLG